MSGNYVFLRAFQIPNGFSYPALTGAKAPSGVGDVFLPCKPALSDLALAKSFVLVLGEV